jgi:hypothetical protein
MHIFANKSSFGARAISGAYLLLLCRPHVASPMVSGKWRKRR